MHPVKPHAGQESVWDYPRPPILAPSSRRVRVVFQGVTIAESTACYRLLETSHPPTWYIPPQDVRTELLIPSPHVSFCEFKGSASYWTLRAGSQESADAAWSYAKPNPKFAAIQDFFCFYASRVDACFVDGEEVQSQQGDFYGGWITSDVAGPFKGARGTSGW